MSNGTIKASRRSEKTPGVDNQSLGQPPDLPQDFRIQRDSARRRVVESEESEIQSMQRSRRRESQHLSTVAEPRTFQLRGEDVQRSRRIFSFLNSQMGESLNAPIGLGRIFQSEDKIKVLLIPGEEELLQGARLTSEIQSDMVGVATAALEQSGFAEYVLNVDLLNAGTSKTHLIFDYTSGRGANQYNLHKDGPKDGRILFQLIIYDNDKEMFSPEYMPDHHLYEQELRLPEEIKKQILEIKNSLQSNPPTKLNCVKIGVRGVFSWCDPLIIHSTPYLGTRRIPGKAAKDAVISHFSVQFGSHAGGMYKYAEDVAAGLEDSGPYLPAHYRMMIAAADLIRQSDETYPEDLVRIGYPAEAFEDPKVAKFTSHYEVAHCFDRCEETLDYRSVDLAQARERRLERELSLNLDDPAISNYPDNRPGILRISMVVEQDPDGHLS